MQKTREYRFPLMLGLVNLGVTLAAVILQTATGATQPVTSAIGFM